MIDIQLFNKQQLSKFIHSDKFKKLDVLPITQHRALSQINNPLADDYDVLLITAFDNNQTVGYIGCLPDYITYEKERIKVYWISTIYVSPQYRGSRLFIQLLNSAISNCNGNILMTEYTKEAENIYKRLPYFEYIEPKAGQRYYFRSALAEILPRRKPVFNKIKEVLRLCDFFINKLYAVRLLFFRNDNSVYAEYLQSAKEEEKKYINNLSPCPMKKDADYINWLLQYPWVIQSCNKNEKYYFSSCAKEFRFELIKLSYKEKTDSIFLLSVRDKHLKIPYFFSEEASDMFIRFLFGYIKKNKITMLTIYNKPVIDKINAVKNTFFLYRKNIERSYMIHTHLKEQLPPDIILNLQDGDSDAAFT